MRAIHVDRGRSVPGPRVRRAVRLAQAAVVLAIVMAPAGCAGSEPDGAWPTTARTGRPVAGAPATTEPVATTTTTGTSKPTTTSTVVPTGDAKLVAAARRAVSDYYLASNVAAETLSTTPFRASFAPDCQPCLEDADFIDDVRSHGQSIEGGTVFVTTQAGTQVTSTTVAVIGEVRVEKTTVRNADGSIAKVYPAEAYPGTVWIVRLDGSQAQVSEIRL